MAEVITLIDDLIEILNQLADLDYNENLKNAIKSIHMYIEDLREEISEREVVML